MESFIVRIYRRSHIKPGEMAGLVETVGSDEKRAFQSFAGLMTALRNAILPADKTAIDRVDCDVYPMPDKKQAG